MGAKAVHGSEKQLAEITEGVGGVLPMYEWAEMKNSGAGGTVDIYLPPVPARMVWFIRAHVVHAGPFPEVGIAGKVVMYRSNNASLYSVMDIAGSIPNISEWGRGARRLFPSESALVRFTNVPAGVDLFTVGTVEVVLLDEFPQASRIVIASDEEMHRPADLAEGSLDLHVKVG